MGMRYGSLVEDFFTGFLLHCEGWRDIFSHPERPAFCGDSPVAFVDMLGQNKRWCIGALQAFFCKFNPLVYGVRSMGLFMGLAYSHYSLWPIWSIPITIYAFIPQFALLNGIPIFPKVNDSWFSLYIFLFVGAYGQDLLEFLLGMPKGCGCFGAFPASSSALPSTSSASKVQVEDLTKRYEQGIYQFGVDSPMFVTVSMAAVINLVALGAGIIWAAIGIRGGDYAVGIALPILLCGFVVVNSWPVHEAMALRKDSGRLPTKTTVVAVLQVLGFCVVGSFLLKVV